MILNATNDNHVKMVIKGIKNNLITAAEIPDDFIKKALEKNPICFLDLFVASKESVHQLATFLSTNVRWLGTSTNKNMLRVFEWLKEGTLTEDELLTDSDVGVILQYIPFPEMVNQYSIQMHRKLYCAYLNCIIPRMSHELFSRRKMYNLSMSFRAYLFQLDNYQDIRKNFVEFCRSQPESLGVKLNALVNSVSSPVHNKFLLERMRYTFPEEFTAIDMMLI